LGEAENVYHGGVANDRPTYQPRERLEDRPTYQPRERLEYRPTYQSRERLEDRPTYQPRERLLEDQNFVHMAYNPPPSINNPSRQYYHLEGNNEFGLENSTAIIRYEQPRRVYQQEKQYYETSAVRRHF